MRRLALALAPVVALALSVPAAAGATPPPLLHDVTVDAPVERVWELLSSADGWKRLGVAQAEVDLRVGGKIRTHVDAAGHLGDDGTIEQTILAFDPERLLAFRTTKAPAKFPFSAEALARTWYVLSLVDSGDGTTRVSLRGHGYGTDEESQRLRAFFEKGNAESLEHFRASLERPDDPLAPIVVERSVGAPCADVFSAWTTSDGFQAFLGTNARIELRPGGPFEIEFVASAPAGSRGSEGCTVLSWLPNRMFSFTWNAPPLFPHARPVFTQVVVELERQSADRTLVRLTHHGFAAKAAADAPNAGEWKSVRAYFAKAWPQVLGALAAHFEK